MAKGSKFKKRTWSRLLTQIEEQKVVPVIGPELLVMDLQGEKIGFYDHLATELAEELEIETEDLPQPFGLNDVVCAYLAEGEDPAEIYFSIQEIISDRSWPTPEPLKQMAAITHFDLFLSTTFDPFLKQALDEVRFNGQGRTPALAYTNMGAVVDLPADFEQSPLPLVYQLFGRVSTSPDYAVSEDDLLQFNHRLQTRDLQPHNLFDLLRGRTLLKLGCRFPDWLARFFLCATKGDQVFSDMGLRGVVADGAAVQDPQLVQFFKRRKTQVYEQGDAVGFVAELHKRWLERFGAAPAPADAPAGDSPRQPDRFEEDAVFLSYASEDRDAVVNLKTALESGGIPVWFDRRRLQAGDDYAAKILENIEKCSLFVPVISRHTDTIEKRRFFRLEWRKAVEEAMFRSDSTPFIMPVVIDDTNQDAPHVLADLKKKHWQWFAGGHPTSEFLGLIKKRIRQLRREKRR